MKTCWTSYATPQDIELLMIKEFMSVTYPKDAVLTQIEYAALMMQKSVAYIKDRIK